jgi:hypothetical protein
MTRSVSVKLRKTKSTKKPSGITCPECSTLLIESDSEKFGLKTCKEGGTQYVYCVDPESGMKKIVPYSTEINSEGLRPRRRVNKGIQFRLDAPDTPKFLKALVAVGSRVPNQLPPPKPPPGTLICSFCGKHVSHVEAVHGVARLSRSIDREYNLSVDPVEVVERVIFSSKKVVACPTPACAGQIKPLKDRDGRITNHNVKTYSEG